MADTVLHNSFPLPCIFLFLLVFFLPWLYIFRKQMLWEALCDTWGLSDWQLHGALVCLSPQLTLVPSCLYHEIPSLRILSPWLLYNTQVLTFSSPLELYLWLMGSSSSSPLISWPPLPCVPFSSAVTILVVRLLCTADRIRAFHIDLVLVSEVRVPGQLGSSKVSLVCWLPSPCFLHGRNRAKDPLDQMRALPSGPIHSQKHPTLQIAS